jgi:hypothetical protein
MIKTMRKDTFKSSFYSILLKKKVIEIENRFFLTLNEVFAHPK